MNAAAGMENEPEIPMGKEPGERMTKALGEHMGKQPGNGTKRAQPHVMGLRIASQIAAAHGGKLLFVGRKSGGYDVTLELPVVTGEN